MANNIFSQEALAISKAYKGILAKVGATAVNFSKERFVQGNWVDRTRKAWKERKVLDKGEGTKGHKKRGILIQTGQLKKSIRLVSINSSRITIGSDVSYAKIHNEGGTISGTVSVRAHKRKKRKGGTSIVKTHSRKMNTKIDQRQFLGPSAILERRIERVIEKEINTALKSI